MRTIILALLALGSSLGAFGKTPTTPKPNVLIIYTDDHRFSGIHALGGEPVMTPHLDQLKADGIAFTNAYLMGSFTGATCVPSRATLHTGRQLFELQGIGKTIPATDTTIGEAFRQAGYHTHIIGKWHQDKQSLVRSFNSGGTIMGLDVYLTDHFRMPLNDWDPSGKFSGKDAYLLTYAADGSTVRTPLTGKEKRGPTGTEANGPHTSQIFADNAIEFIRQYKEPQPYLLYLAFHAPHDPRQAPQKYRDMYPPDQIKLPPSYLAQHPFDNGHMVLRDEELAPWPRTPAIARQHLADYYATITHLDEQIGRVIAQLKASGQYENTLIVMAGDSGLAVGNHGLMGKQNVYSEDGNHVPFIIAGGAAPGHNREEKALCYIQDIFPTICDLTGVPIPASVTGLSLAPVIRKQTDKIHDYTYHAYLQYQRAYRQGDYKLIEYVRAPDKDAKGGAVTVRGSRVTQLFNLAKDPWETTDLSFYPEQAERVTTMRQAMRAAAIALNDRKERVGTAYDFWDYYEPATTAKANQ